MIDQIHLQTVATALAAMHEHGKSLAIDDPMAGEAMQNEVWEAWHALGLPGQPWEF
jgi:hypothetical protein